MDEQDDAAGPRAAAKPTHNSGEGCRELARASLAEASLSAVPNLRRRLEHSAAVWTARAEMLERVARLRGKRLAAAGVSGPSA